jgi:hypothetical protein
MKARALSPKRGRKLGSSALLDPIDQRKALWLQRLHGVRKHKSEDKDKHKRISDLRSHFEEIDCDRDG